MRKPEDRRDRMAFLLLLLLFVIRSQLSVKLNLSRYWWSCQGGNKRTQNGEKMAMATIMKKARKLRRQHGNSCINLEFGDVRTNANANFETKVYQWFIRLYLYVVPWLYTVRNIDLINGRRRKVDNGFLFVPKQTLFCAFTAWGETVSMKLWFHLQAIP